MSDPHAERSGETLGSAGGSPSGLEKSSDDRIKQDRMPVSQLESTTDRELSCLDAQYFQKRQDTQVERRPGIETLPRRGCLGRLYERVR